MRDVLILCYHAVSPSWPAALSVTPDAFAEQVQELARRGYRGMRFSEAIAQPHSGRVAAFTFDDNYRSVLEQAKPILDRHGFPGTLYVPTDWPGQQQPMRWPGIDRWLGTPHEHELMALSWRELRKLADEGWEIGSHTRSHSCLPELDDETLREELAGSKARLEEKLGRPCTSLAYPYGAVDERVARAAGEAGYLGAGTIPRVLSRPEALLWPRTPIFHVDDLRRFKLKVSFALRHLRASRLGVSLDRARVALANRG